VLKDVAGSKKIKKDAGEKGGLGWKSKNGCGQRVPQKEEASISGGCCGDQVGSGDGRGGKEIAGGDRAA